MSFDRDAMSPHRETHVPVRVDVPADDLFVVDRPVMPTPHLFQTGSVVDSKDGKRANEIVRCVDYATSQIRLVGEPRTMWHSCDGWLPRVTLSPQAVKLEETRRKLQEELAQLDAGALAAVEVLADDADPSRALAKIEAMRRLGIIKSSAAPTPAEVVSAKEAKK